MEPIIANTSLLVFGYSAYTKHKHHTSDGFEPLSVPTSRYSVYYCLSSIRLYQLTPELV